MDINRETFLTTKGLEKLKQELNELKGRRKDVAARIQDAKELGDLSENAEYTEAKNEQSFIEGRILELETILKNATVVRESDGKTDKVRVGTTVKTESKGSEVIYEIVGVNEAEPTKGRISHESPLGQAFMGKAVGDTVEIEVPKGVRTFKIISIQ